MQVVAMDIQSSSDHQERQADAAFSTSRLYTAAAAFHEYLIPRLDLQLVLALGHACSDWHAMIFEMPVTDGSDQQPLASSSENSLQPGQEPCKSLRDALRKQATITAKLRDGSGASGARIQRVDWTAEAVRAISWIPPRNLLLANQWLVIQQLQKREGSPPIGREGHLAVLDSYTGQFASFSTTSTQFPGERLLVPDAMTLGTEAYFRTGPFADMSPMTTDEAFGRLPWLAVPVAYGSLAAAPIGRAIMNQTANLWHDHFNTFVVAKPASTTSLAIQNRDAAGSCAAVPLSPDGSKITWLVSQRRAPSQSLRLADCQNEFAVLSLPDYVELYRVHLPTTRCSQVPANYVMVARAPSRKIFAVYWESRLCPDFISIHSAASGECICCELMQPSEFCDKSMNFYGWLGLTRLDWLPSSKHLLFSDHNALVLLDTSAKTVWASMPGHREFFPYAGVNHYHDLSVLSHWSLSEDGLFILIADQRKVDNDDRGPGAHSLKFDAQVNILEALTGRLVHSLMLPGKHHGTLSWATQRNTCLVHDHGIVISKARGRPGSSTTAVSSWHEYSCTNMILRDNSPAAWVSWEGLDQMLAEGSPSSPRLSPCGTIIIGLASSLPAGTFATVGASTQCASALQHWHLSHANSQGHVQPTICSGIFKAPVDLATLAWHPRKQGGIYAVFDMQSTLHLIDAKANCQLRFWACSELRNRHPVGRDFVELAAEAPKRNASGPALDWSQDGCKLAAFRGQTCAVLLF